MKIKVEISYINAKNKFNITNKCYISIRIKNIHVVFTIDNVNAYTIV